jgi:MFS family permease
VPPEAHGRAFGFEGAMDTLGAVIGPAIALSLVGVIALRHIFLIAFIPGAITVLIVLFVVQEIPKSPQPHLRIIGALRDLPRPFWRYVAAVTVFGLGNFAHTLLVLRAVTLLTPRYGSVLAGRYGIALYILHNIVYAAVSYPAGALGDRANKKTLLSVGYALFGIMCLLFIASPTLGGHLKTGHTWTLQNRPTGQNQNNNIYTLPGSRGQTVFPHSAYTDFTWAEDTATLGSDRSADSAAGMKGGAEPPFAPILAERR